MFGRFQIRIAGSARLVAVLSVVFLGAIALALPPSPIQAGSSGAGRRGCVFGHSLLIDNLAEQLAQDGYSYLVVDLGSEKGGSDELWVQYLLRINSRRFPVWGWIDVRKNLRNAPDLARSLPLGGLFLYGPNAVAEANRLRGQRLPIEIVPVIRFGEPAPTEGRYAVVMDLETFLEHAESTAIPVLDASTLAADAIDSARESGGRDYVIAYSSLGD